MLLSAGCLVVCSESSVEAVLSFLLSVLQGEFVVDTLTTDAAPVERWPAEDSQLHARVSVGLNYSEGDFLCCSRSLL